MDDMHHEVRAPKPGIRWLLLLVILAVVGVLGYGAGVQQSQLQQNTDLVDNSIIDDGSADGVQETQSEDTIASTKELSGNEVELGYTLSMPLAWHATVDYQEGLLPAPDQYKTTLLIDPVAVTLIGRDGYFQFKLGELYDDDIATTLGIEQSIDPNELFKDDRSVALDTPGTARAVRIPPSDDVTHAIAKLLHTVVFETESGLFFHGQIALGGKYPNEVQAILDSLSFE